MSNSAHSVFLSTPNRRGYSKNNLFWSLLLLAATVIPTAEAGFERESPTIPMPDRDVDNGLYITIVVIRTITLAIYLSFLFWVVHSIV